MRWQIVAAGPLGLTLGLSGADSHSWYPRACCSDRDCTLADEVETDQFGNFVVRMGDRQIPVSRDLKPQISPDGRIHICLREEPDLGIVLPVCLFLPAQS
jgi:hypothetical protein